jgi:hypothetical protein
VPSGHQRYRSLKGGRFLKTLKIFAGAAGLFLFFLAAAPLPLERTAKEISGSGSPETSAPETASPDFLFPAAAQSVFLPIVFRPPSSGVLAVLIDHFLLFVPPPSSS